MVYAWWIEDVARQPESMLVCWLSNPADVNTLSAEDMSAIIVAELMFRTGGACRLAA